MKKKVKFITLSILMFTSCVVFSQENKEVNYIIENNIEAIGGIDKIKAIKNIKFDKINLFGGVETSEVVIIEPFESLFLERTFPKGKYIISLYNNEGWILDSSKSNNKLNLNEEEKKVFSITMRDNLFGPLYNYYMNKERSGIKEIISSGEKIIQNEPSYRLKIIYETGYIDYAYVSKKSFLINQIENTLGTTLISNYKKTNGVYFAQDIEVLSSYNDSKAIISIISTKINTTINHDIFSKK